MGIAERWPDPLPYPPTVKPSALHIAMISEHASPLAPAGGVDAGGQNTYVDQAARALVAAGHRVDVLTRCDDGRLAPTVEVLPGLRVVHLRAGPTRFIPKEELLPLMPQFVRSAQRHFGASPRYDLVHAHFFMSGHVGLALRQRFHTPLVMSFHALGLVRRQHQREADRFPAQRIDIERRLVQGADRVVASCPQDQADLVQLYGADPARLAQVPCGVDVHTLHPGGRQEARQALRLAADEFVVLQVGRMVPRKGIDNVVRALALLADEPGLPRARLLIVGGDAAEADEAATPEIGRLRRLAGELGIADRVQFAGRHAAPALRRFYVAADVFVTTPWYEPFGITPLEAMACGTPVVGSAVGGIQHSVLPQVTGHLVPPNDPPALAARLAELRRDPVRAAAMGRAGVERVRTLFTWDVVAHGLAGVYRAALRPATAGTGVMPSAVATACTPAAALALPTRLWP